MPSESYNEQQQRVIAEITRLWVGTAKSNEQTENREAVLSLFFQTAVKYPFTALSQTVDRWIAENRWFPSATKDFEDELRTARDRVTPQLANHNDPWAKIRAASPREWSSQLVELYEDQNRGLSLKARMILQSQAMDMVFKNGGGSFGVHPHPVWPPSKCLQVTRYA